MKYRYSDKEIDLLLKNICIVCDTREQENKHIIEYFDKKKINYRSEGLKVGDYTACIIANEETAALGITRDTYFNDVVVIERKANIEEIANNFTNKADKLSRERLEREFLKIHKSGAKLILIIENNRALEDIINWNYNSKYNNKSLYSSLKSFEARFNINLKFIDKAYSGLEIYNTIKYYIREVLK